MPYTNKYTSRGNVYSDKYAVAMDSELWSENYTPWDPDSNFPWSDENITRRFIYQDKYI